MRTLIRLAAGLQAALLFPALLFLTAVLVGTGDPPQYELVRVAQGIVTWYAARMWTLWLLLLILPLAVLAGGCLTLLRSSNQAVELPVAAAAPVATFLVAGTTFTSAGVLAVVVLHMLAN
jgi:hypothetical protein